MTPGLYLVGTPIGNLADITLRALEVLRGVEAILTEDTRHAQILLHRYEIRAPLLSCHKFNEASRSSWAVERIRAGAALALVSNSGMPCISDPGARLVAACREAGLPVTAAPGPTAVATAVALSGWRGGGFVFDGFLPRKSGARARRLAELAALRMTVVLYESPHRLLRLLAEIGAAFGPRRLFIARELTKKFEETLTGTPDELQARLGNRSVKGEVTLVVAPD